MFTVLFGLRAAVPMLPLTPATLLGAWVGKKIVGSINDRIFVKLVETGLLAAGVLFLIGL